MLYTMKALLIFATVDGSPTNMKVFLLVGSTTKKDHAVEPDSKPGLHQPLVRIAAALLLLILLQRLVLLMIARPLVTLSRLTTLHLLSVLLEFAIPILVANPGLPLLSISLFHKLGPNTSTTLQKRPMMLVLLTIPTFNCVRKTKSKEPPSQTPCAPLGGGSPQEMGTTQILNTVEVGTLVKLLQMTAEVQLVFDLGLPLLERVLPIAASNRTENLITE